MTWQPIQTAPKDGTPVLLLPESPIDSNDMPAWAPWESVHATLGWWHPRENQWVACYANYQDSGCSTCGGWYEWPAVNRPTHWMPLPPPPQTGSDE